MPAHLIECNMPMSNFCVPLEVACSRPGRPVVVEHPKISFIWDSQEHGKLELNALNVCGKCVLAVKVTSGIRYLYGIVDAAKLKANEEFSCCQI